MKDLALYRRRRISNGMFLFLSAVASLFGLVWLGFILFALLHEGFSGISARTFIESTPVPGSEGGLANAIFGSLTISLLAVTVGTPIGILAGTYLAEYGRYGRLAFFVRFINDILLSAPSIVTGLFIYEIIVFNVPDSYVTQTCNAALGTFPSKLFMTLGLAHEPMNFCFLGHPSGIAGALALAMIVIPVVTRVTENMLLLVPNGLREAAAALGAPRSRLIRAVTWRAARAGIVTGVLFAVARISGETAPLIFTTLGNNFWSTDLNAPIASLPKVIFDFANQPDEISHRLAWAGALLVTAAVLTLSVIARILETSRRSN